MMNLLEGLQAEIKRNQELLTVYKELPAQPGLFSGLFGAMMIERKIMRGEMALVSGDAIEMLAAYAELKGSE